MMEAMVSMHAIRHILVSAMCLSVLAACALEPVNKPVEAVHRGSGEEIAELRRQTGCSEGEVLVCIQMNCMPENYACADPRAVRRMFETRTKHWP